MEHFLPLRVRASNPDQPSTLAVEIGEYTLWPMGDGFYELVIRSSQPQIDWLEIIPLAAMLQKRGMALVLPNREQDVTKLVSVSFTLPATARSAELRGSL